MRLRSFSALVAIVAAVAALTLPVTAPALAAPVLHIGIAYDTGGVGDHSINDAAAAAVIAVQKKFSVMVDATVTIGTDADRESRIRALVAKGCDPVVVVGSGYATTIKKVSLDFPDHKFAILNDASVDSLNVAALVFSESQGGYLAGVAGALVSKKQRLGLIAGLGQSPDYENGFLAGAKATNKKIVVDTKYVGGDGGAIASAHINSGSDVLFLTTSGSDASVFSAVVSANKAGKSVGLIGVEPDQYLTLTAEARKYILASVVKRFDRALIDFITQASADRMLTDVINSELGVYGRRYGIAENAIGLSLWSPTLAKFAKSINIAAVKASKLSTLG